MDSKGGSGKGAGSNPHMASAPAPGTSTMANFGSAPAGGPGYPPQAAQSAPMQQPPMAQPNQPFTGYPGMYPVQQPPPVQFVQAPPQVVVVQRPNVMYVRDSNTQLGYALNRVGAEINYLAAGTTTVYGGAIVQNNQRVANCVRCAAPIQYTYMNGQQTNVTCYRCQHVNTFI